MLVVILLFLGLARAHARAGDHRPRDDHPARSPRWPRLGFTVNMLTLFGLVLAIGIVVDDAIVIVENAAHHIDHDRLETQDRTIKAMGEVIGPVIGITLVLMAVFVPTAFRGASRASSTGSSPDDRRDRLDQRDQRRDAQARAVRSLVLRPTPEHRNAFCLQQHLRPG
ncbi:MAG: efflux RND transporter permease subunit [Isosphaeraceae bacterium]